MEPNKDQVKKAAKSIFIQKGALSAASYLAETLFEGMTDKAGALYTGHLQRVAHGVPDYHIKPIAFMHDIIEDIEGWEREDLTDIGFDDFTTDGVVGVTRNQDEPYFDFIIRCGQTPQSIPVKRSDLKDNGNIFRMPGLPTETDIERLKKYHISDRYLADIEYGSIKPGTPMTDYMIMNPQLRDMELLKQHSSEGSDLSVIKTEETVKALQERTNRDMGSKWNPEELKTPRLPVLFDQVTNKTPFDTPVTLQSRMTKCSIPEGLTVKATKADPTFVNENGLYVEDIPIKFPDTDYRVPEIIWNNFGDLLTQQMELEKKINPHIDEQYVYLTIQQGMVGALKTQRRGGIHLDGYQKPSIVPQLIQHQISVTNALPTVFFAAAANENTVNLPKKELFGALAEDCRNAPSYQPPSYHLHLLNAYCPHEPAAEQDEQFRTFIRFSISSLPFMGADNTRNPLFDYEWTPERKAEFYRKITKPELM